MKNENKTRTSPVNVSSVWILVEITRELLARLFLIIWLNFWRIPLILGSFKFQLILVIHVLYKLSLELCLNCVLSICTFGICASSLVSDPMLFALSDDVHRSTAVTSGHLALW